MYILIYPQEEKISILVVSMKTSALYAVTEHRGVEIASAQVISDVLTESRWQPAFSKKRVLSSIETLLRIVAKVASKA